MTGRDDFIAVNGLRLRYREWGAASGFPVLFLHGITGHVGMWEQVTAALAADYRCIALDLRGYGWSEHSPTGEYDRNDHAADVAAVVEALGLERLALVGFSLGGTAAMLYAAQRPERVTRLVIAETGAELPVGQRAPRPDIAPLLESFPELAAAVAWARGLDLYRRASADFLAAYLAEGLQKTGDGRLTWRFDPLIRRRLASSSRTPAAPLWYLLPAIACPTLLVRGAESPNLSVRMAQRMLAAIPNCRLVEIPGAGHGVVWDNSELFTTILSNFLGEKL